MTESKLQSWWRTEIMPALLDRPLHPMNRAAIEAVTVELDGTQLLVRCSADHVIASPLIADLITEMIGERPPPAPLTVRSARFPEMPWRSAMLAGVTRRTR